MESYFNELQKRRADYREEEELYLAVQQLSETTKGSLKGFFKGGSVQEFIVCGEWKTTNFKVEDLPQYTVEAFSCSAYLYSRGTL
jgi:hypothetical protein